MENYMRFDTIDSYIEVIQDSKGKETYNKMYVNTKFLCAYFSKDAKTISRWKKDGMPKATKPSGLKARGDFFHIQECQEWVDKNINKTKSRATEKKSDRLVEVQSSSDDDIDETVNDIQGKIRQANEMLQLKGTTHDDADRIKKILDGLIQAVKLGEQTKELIPKKDTEKVIVEFVATLIAGYKRDIKILPKECNQRNEEEIREILESTYKSNIEKYQKIAKSKILSEAKLYDVIEVVVELIHDEVSVDEIIKRLKFD
jgi:hypothetical protein